MVSFCWECKGCQYAKSWPDFDKPTPFFDIFKIGMPLIGFVCSWQDKCGAFDPIKYFPLTEKTDPISGGR